MFYKGYGSVIGGSDGPTSIFLAGKIGAPGINWISIFGLILVLLLLAPNLIYALRCNPMAGRRENAVLHRIEQIGRYACMLFMVWDYGFGASGFTSLTGFVLYFIGNIFLILLYWLTWMLYFTKTGPGKSMALAVIPVLIFLLSGITLRHPLLIASALVFGISHTVITWKNTASDPQNPVDFP